MIENASAMYSVVLSGATEGINARIIRVETHIAATISMFSVVGLPDSVVRESRERVYAAIKTSGYKFPTWRITVNLAPAEIRKEGSALDLPIAVGILTAVGDVRQRLAGSYVLLGELALDGALRPVHGVLSIVVEAKDRGMVGVIVPRENMAEAALVDGVKIIPVSSLRETIGILEGKIEGRTPVRATYPAVATQTHATGPDIADVRGQDNAKRAIEIAASGGHNMLMIGPPGSGKTMLARTIPTILPPLNFRQAIDVTRIHSVAGILSEDSILPECRPFRAPHHTISYSAMVGGGVHPRPGEISLAHHGVLFLDEVPEFSRNVLQALRQPMESGRIIVNRTKATIEFPSAFLLVCAMNPCLCGYYTDPSRQCTCTPAQVQKYLGKISGPLLDRIDVHIEVPAVGHGDLTRATRAESSASVRARVVGAHAIQMNRFGDRTGPVSNAWMSPEDMRSYCVPDEAGNKLLRDAMKGLGFSARAYTRILKVARTIADLSAETTILPEHISEAIQYRSMDWIRSQGHLHHPPVVPPS